ncbi:MAG: hypothetical protein AAB393_01540, partial [Bacteroidota bacterium]
MRKTAMEVGMAKGMRKRWLALTVTLAFTGTMVLPVRASQTIDLTDEPAYQEGYEQGQAYRESYQQPIEEKAKEDEKDAVNALLVAGGVAIVVGLVYYFCIRDDGGAHTQTRADSNGA